MYNFEGCIDCIGRHHEYLIDIRDDEARMSIVDKSLLPYIESYEYVIVCLKMAYSSRSMLGFEDSSSEEGREKGSEGDSGEDSGSDFAAYGDDSEGMEDTGA